MAWFFNAGAAQADEGAIVWYRASNDCPDGSVFVAQVQKRQRNVQLAELGDRPDFVVTLGTDGESSTGRLERQTSEGIVAIKEVRGSSCAEVADALALTLALANDEARPSALEVETPATGEREPEASSSQPSRPVATDAAPRITHPPARTPPVEPTPKVEVPTFLSATARGRTAVAPRGAWGAALHLERGSGTAIPWRVGLQGAHGSQTTSRGKLEMALWTGQLELCPVKLDSPVVVASWCGGLEVGTMRVQSEAADGVRDSGPWAALTLRERVSWQATRTVAMVADLGVFAPLTRYEIVTKNPPDELHEVSPAGLDFGLGVVVRTK